MGERKANFDDALSGNGLVAEAVAAFAASVDNADPFHVGFRDAFLPMAISDPQLPDNPIIFINGAFEQLTGYARDDVIGRNCRFLQGPSTDAKDVARLAGAIRSLVPITIDLLNHRRDGAPFWNRLHVAPVFSDAGTVRYFVASQTDVTLERERLARLETEQQLLLAEAEEARAALADTTRRLQIGVVAGAFGSWARDPANDRLDASAGCKAIFGRAPDDVFDHDAFVGSLHPDDRQRVLAAVADTEKADAPYDVEYRVIRPDGEMRWIAAKGEMLRRGDGSPLSMNGFVTDITERRALDEQRQLTARELGHRIKNTLATVSAVVNQSLRSAGTLDDARRAITGRIQSLASAHDVLIDGAADSAMLGRVAGRVLTPFDPDQKRIFIEGPAIEIERDLALALSMAMHELATNAIKYGALSQSDGRVELMWALIDGDRLRLHWLERGGPSVTSPSREGFGSILMRRVLGPRLASPLRSTFAATGFELTADLKLGRADTEPRDAAVCR